MKSFMDDNFLLTTETARELFQETAKKMPILDYHCHINPEEIAKDRRFENITQVWLGGDHYKWRLMRANGIEEHYITGDASDKEKFLKWAQTLEKAIGNPLFHWNHLELQRYFGYHGVLNTETAEEVWELCNKKLQNESMSARNLIRQSNVNLICTTDDPADDLHWHEMIKEDESFQVQVLPAWRPDKAMNLEKTDYTEYLEKLEKASGMLIRSFRDLKEALKKRMLFFDKMRCRASDHGLEYVMYVPETEENVEKIFAKRLSGKNVTREEELKFKTAFMQFAAEEYSRLGWVMQLHYGCKRDNNTKMYKKIGPDTGYDCISNYTPGSQLADFLNSLEQNNHLPKTILYSLNPNDDEMIETIMGCFQNSDAVGKIQHGSAWWFNDNQTGMKKQLTSFANQSILGNFIGMLESIVKGISYNNAVRYFGFDLEEQ